MRLTTITSANRAEIVKAVEQAPIGYRVAVNEPVRSLAQNSLLWALLDAFADQVEHCGRKYDAGDWKCIFMKALGKELSFAPTLGGQGIVAIGYRSSRLSKEDMANLIELIYAEGTQRGVVFHGEERMPIPLGGQHSIIDENYKLLQWGVFHEKKSDPT